MPEPVVAVESGHVSAAQREGSALRDVESEHQFDERRLAASAFADYCRGFSGFYFEREAVNNEGRGRSGIFEASVAELDERCGILG